MGIQGLLRGLSQHLISENGTPSNSKTNHSIRQFANKSLAIDTSSWLFKASYSCAECIVESIDSNKIDPTCERIICNYIIKRCDELLINASIKNIILVFDGKRCPLKAVTNIEREKKRTKNLKEARRLKACGKVREAQEKYKACLKVTDWMGDRVNRAVTRKWGNERHSMLPPKVRCVFSPYEADSQLAKLCIDGFADAIVTEDSDILVYSAACGMPFPVIYKLDRNSGKCDVMSMDWLLSTPRGSEGIALHDPSFPSLPSLKQYISGGFDRCNDEDADGKEKIKRKKGAGAALLSHLRAMVTRESRQPGSGARLFVQSCILAGCDYAPSRLSGVGLVTAFKMIMENSHREPCTRFSHVLKAIPRDKIGLDIDVDDVNLNEMQREGQNGPQPNNLYEELLAKSEAVFYYHYVLHLKSRNTAPLMTPVTDTNVDGAATTMLSDEQVQFKGDNKSRMRYFPCLKRFAPDISFIGSEQAHIEPASDGELTATTFSNTSESSSTIIKRQLRHPVNQEKSHFFSKRLGTGPKQLGRQKRISKVPCDATKQSIIKPIYGEGRDTHSHHSSRSTNISRVNPFQKYALSTQKMNKNLGVIQKETDRNKDKTLKRQADSLHSVCRAHNLSDDSSSVLENVIHKDPPSRESVCLEGGPRSYAIPTSSDNSSKRYQRADSMSSVSSIDSLSITPCTKKKQKWSKFFTREKDDEDVSVTMKPIFTTEKNNMECYLSRSSCENFNLITPPSDIRQRARSIIGDISIQGGNKSSDRDSRKLNHFLSADEDSDSVVVIRTLPAPHVSSIQKSPYCVDVLKQKETSIEVDGSSTIDINDSTSNNSMLYHVQKPRPLLQTNKSRFKTKTKHTSERMFPSRFKQSAMANKRINTCLRSTKPRSNTQSIKGFFSPLNTKHLRNNTR